MPNVIYHADIEGMSGKQSDQVYTKARSGPTRRSRVKVTNPNTPKQAAQRFSYGKIAAVYTGLDLLTVQTWDAFASTLRWVNAKTGRAYVPTGNMVFTSLASKFLQMHPTQDIPTTPPTAGFIGDSPGIVAIGGAGLVTFSASTANSPGVNTELLLQKLARVSRRPRRDGYNLREFVVFSTGGLDASMTVPPGIYACGYRFVQAGTGQSTNMVKLDIVTVS